MTAPLHKRPRSRAIPASAALAFVVAAITFSSAQAADTPGPLPSIESYRQQGYKVSKITPIFSQLLLTAFPPGFELADEKPTATQYMQESVLKGETVDNWTQMITIDGYKGLADNPNVTPERFASVLAAGFGKACPGSFNAAKLNGGPGPDTEFLAVMSCGISPTDAGKSSETTLFIVIKGAHELYTVQWAERGQPSTTPLPIDGPKWADRIRQLSPIKLCTVVPGEEQPYTSCVGGK